MKTALLMVSFWFQNLRLTFTQPFSEIVKRQLDSILFLENSEWFQQCMMVE